MKIRVYRVIIGLIVVLVGIGLIIKPREYIVNNSIANVSISIGNLLIENKSLDRDLAIILERGNYKNTYIIDKDSKEKIAIPYSNGKYKVTTVLLDGNKISDKYEQEVNMQYMKYADVMESLIGIRLRKYYYTNYDNRLIGIVDKVNITDLEFTDKVYEYIMNNIKYDTDLSKEITLNNIVKYRPNIDNILESKKGICLDYASLMASILMTNGVKAEVKIGFNSNNQYHAWVSVYINKEWLDYDPTLGIKYNDNDMKKYKVQGIY